MKQFSSNDECLSLQRIIPFSLLIGYPKSGILQENWEPPWQKLHGVDNQGLVDAIRRTPKLTMNHNKAVKHVGVNGHLPMQHIVPFLVQRDYLAQIWYVVYNLRIVCSRNGTIWTITGLWMLPEAPLTFLIHVQKDMKQFSSNGCLSLQRVIPFSLLIGYQKSGILQAIWEPTLTETTWCGQ